MHKINRKCDILWKADVSIKWLYQVRKKRSVEKIRKNKSIKITLDLHLCLFHSKSTLHWSYSADIANVARSFGWWCLFIERESIVFRLCSMLIHLDTLRLCRFVLSDSIQPFLLSPLALISHNFLRNDLRIHSDFGFTFYFDLVRFFHLLFLML